MIEKTKYLIKYLLLKRRNLVVKKIFYDHELFKSLFKKLRPINPGINLIRIGSLTDGGYLLPDDFKGIKYCYSPGVSDNSSFEEDLYKKYEIESFLCDNTIEKPNSKSKGLSFIKKHLTIEDSINTIKLKSWLESFKSDNEMIMQMDIEGHEYKIILDTEQDILEKFRIIIIEFHSFEEIFTYGGFKLIEFCFEKLLRTHSIVHIHPNNIVKPFKYKNIEIPAGLEITFLRNDRIKTKTYSKSFPHKFDKPCLKLNKDFPLPEVFYNPEKILK